MNCRVKRRVARLGGSLRLRSTLYVVASYELLLGRVGGSRVPNTRTRAGRVWALSSVGVNETVDGMHAMMVDGSDDATRHVTCAIDQNVISRV